MKVGIASEHAGYKLKETLKRYLMSEGYEVVDYGTDSEESVDYAPICFEIGEDVSSGKVDKGIVICGTGIGVSIAVNKVKGVIAALCRTPFEAELSRRHNNSNILCLGGWITGEELARKMVSVWLTTPFDGDRHERRVQQILDYKGSV